MPGKIAQDGPYKEIAGLVYTDIPANETWMVDANGFPQRLYPERDAKPSPDGGRVLIDREEDIWLVDLFTGEQQNLTAGSNRINGSSQWWPANPDTIIFNSTSFDNPASMSFGQPSMMQQDGSDYQALDENYSFWRPATAPDGKTIAYDTATAAWLYNTDSGKEQLDPASYGLVVPEDFKIGSPAWSPDGTQVTWWVGGSFPPSGIWKMALASFDLTNKSYSFLHEYQPVGGSGGWREPAQWSPDGEWLAFTTQGQGRVPELMIMRADGSETVSLGSGTLQLWSPDSSKLLFIRYDGSYIESQIIMVELDTMQSTVLDLPPGSQQIQWGLR
jgi:Tol biopolymer transport system component